MSVVLFDTAKDSETNL